ncbi:MAG: RidA family protein [Acidimicrobiales bacterium]|nr:RidA family protein [Acidimicrobiales bacterium]
MNPGPSRPQRRKLTPQRFTPTGGAYSHGLSVEVGCGAVIFTTGQLAIDPESRVVGLGDAASQVRYVIENIEQILSEDDAGLADIVTAQMFLLDMRDYESVIDVFNEYFTASRPPLGVVGVTGLARDGCVVELEAVAFRSSINAQGS